MNSIRDFLLDEFRLGEYGYYFVATHLASGARAYSEPIYSYEDAVNQFYQGDILAQYFGGTVELYAINPDDFDIIITASY